MAKLPSEQELKGMTVNARLFVYGLFEEWDMAVTDKDKNEMVSILIKANLSKEQAIETSNIILENPNKYGF